MVSRCDGVGLLASFSATGAEVKRRQQCGGGASEKNSKAAATLGT